MGIKSLVYSLGVFALATAYSAMGQTLPEKVDTQRLKLYLMEKRNWVRLGTLEATTRDTINGVPFEYNLSMNFIHAGGMTAQFQ